MNEMYRARLGDAAWVADVVEGVWRGGYVILPNFLSPEGFIKLSDFARALPNKDHQKVGVVPGTIAYDFGHSLDFMTFYQEVYKARCIKEGIEYVPLSEKKQKIGLPYKDARDGKKTEETDYHYDGAYVNTTLAIQMPPSGGELIAFPNIRRSRYAFVPRVYSRALRHLPFLRRMVPHVIAKTVPNDLCLFFGDRTFHGVEPISSGERLIITINAHW